jgi:uncharacterized protein
MDTLENLKTELRRLKPEIESLYPIRLVSVFGSFARGEQTAESDVDVLAEPGVGKPSLFDIVGVEQLLEKKLHRKVDLVMMSSIRERIKDRVLSEAVPL